MPAGVTLQSFGTMIWSAQARFIGAGTIGIAAIWTLGTLFKPMMEGVRASMGVGESLVGVALAGEGFAGTAQWLGLAALIAVCVGFCRRVLAAR